MGLFDFFKNKKTTLTNNASKILLAMPMFNNGDRYQLNTVIDHLIKFWGLKISEVTGDDNTAVFEIDGEMVALAYMAIPIPWGDIEGTAQYSYNWQTAIEDLKNHKGHAIVSIMAGQKTPLERFAILSKVLCSIAATSNAIGIYQGEQSLLIPTSQYIDNCEMLKQNKIPVMLWVYIGIRKSDNGNSVYTYGLTAFDKLEMEIIDSKLPHEDLYDFISNICSYVIKSNIIFKAGETLGYTATQKVKISASKGQFITGKTLKLAM